MLAGVTKLNSHIRFAVRDRHLDAYTKFALALHAIWRQTGERPRLGLAISGGVDSMALAFLCHQMLKDDFQRVSPLYNVQDCPKISAIFSAFIVDHKMRKNSSTEAQQVAAELARLGIEPHVLELDWQSHGDPSHLTNVETAARTLRYQAMGRACRDRGINTLLFAHHADDQHETILSRIHSRYLGSGLRGMDTIANIPECAGIYGVDHSDRLAHEQEQDGRMRIESGGVTIGRPLLPLGKDELVKICQDNGVKWFEDHTNNDPTLTIRNTFRHLVGKQQLPVAFSKQRLIVLSVKVSEEYNDAEAIASRVFNGMPIALDLRLGAAAFTIETSLMIRSGADRKLHAMLLRRMLEVVSCKSTISLQTIQATADTVLNSDKLERTSKTIQIAGVEISEDRSEGSKNGDHRTLLFRRALPTNSEQIDCQLPLIPQNAIGKEWSDWILWDGRYWVRVRPPGHDSDRDFEIIIKFLSVQDLELLRSTLTTRQKQDLNSCLSIAKGSVRFTVPAIVARKRRGDIDAEAVDRVVALPTLDWSVDGWKSKDRAQDLDVWLWDIRYKHVDLNLNGAHRVMS